MSKANTVLSVSISVSHDHATFTRLQADRYFDGNLASYIRALIEDDFANQRTRKQQIQRLSELLKEEEGAA